jgi:ABC-type nitrate/sulfonate/bicarbonate transport system substrate-binding protein
MKKSIAFAIFILALAIAGILFISQPKDDFSGTMEDITIGAPALETNALVYVAEDQGYFKKNGLNATIRTYDSGGAAVPGLLHNETDLVLASEFVIVNAVFHKDEFRTLGSIDKFENMFMIARRDQGIERVRDLKNRTIGVPEGTIAEFYLGRYLNLHNILLDDVALVDIRPDHSAEALAKGKVDAVVTWHPYLDKIPDRYGDRLIVWPIQSSQLTYWNIISRKDWADSHQYAIDRLLRSIAQASEYAMNQPQRTKMIVQEKLNYTNEYMARVWPDHQFTLSLDQSLVLAMEDEGRWMINNNLTNARKLPDFRKHIYPEGLMRVNPNAINVIG